MPRPSKKTAAPPPAAPSSPASRPPLERMMQLHSRLLAGSYPNCRTMGEALEVSSKTVQRDLDFMRDRLGMPIAYDATRAGFYYTEPVAGFPSIEVTEGELVALFVAQKALGLYQGTAFEQQVAAAFRKLTLGLQEKISFGWNEMEGALSFRSVGTVKSDLALFQEVSRAVLQGRELRFEYRKITGDRHEVRRLHPYHLGCVKNQWYAIGHDPLRGEMRTFALVRMRKAKMTETPFERPADFSISAHLEPSFGVMSGKGASGPVRLRFDAFAGRMVLERQWHPSQKLKELPGGEVELELVLGNFEEIKRWCLSWGAHVQVLGPPELVEVMRATARKVGRLYQ